MSFNFKYKPVILKSGNKIYRPLIPLTINGKDSLFDALAILDSGSDITIIPKEIADTLDIEYTNDNSISGLSGEPVKAKEGKVNIEFGKGREIYLFDIPILVPTEQKNMAIIMGRQGFFNQFKITFDESNKKIGFKKCSNLFLFKTNQD